MEAHSVVCVRRNSVELPYIIRTMYMFSTDERPSWLEGLLSIISFFLPSR